MDQWTQSMGHGAVVVERNGIAEAPPRRMPIKTKRIDLDGDYAGWHATVRSNAPLGVFLGLTQVDTSGNGLAALGEVINSLPALVLAWNFVDEDGDAIPVTVAGCRKLPLDLLQALLGGLLSGEESTVPKD